MTQLPPDDREWQDFLRQNSPTPPPPAAEFEEQLMKAIDKQTPTKASQKILAASPVIAAGLLMAWNSYRTLVTSSDVRLEAFLENNWNGVVGETQARSQSNSPEAEWMVLANTGQ